jgi:hypothetical protein
MVTASIIINQTGKPPGLPGESRDDLSTGATVTLSNEENSGVVSWNWRLLAKPPGSVAGLTTPTASICTFTPDVPGSYRIQLLLNGRIQAMAIAAVKTYYLSLRIPAVGELNELGGWEKELQTIIGQLEDGIQAGGGGGGGSGQYLVFSDDTQFSESDTTFVTKKLFRIVRDSHSPPTSWRVVVSLWGTSSYDTAGCRILATGSGGTDTLVLTTITNTNETIVIGTLPITSAYEPQNSLITIEIQLRLETGSGSANLRYTDVYAMYS